MHVNWTQYRKPMQQIVSAIIPQDLAYQNWWRLYGGYSDPKRIAEIFDPRPEENPQKQSLNASPFVSGNTCKIKDNLEFLDLAMNEQSKGCRQKGEVCTTWGAGTTRPSNVGNHGTVVQDQKEEVEETVKMAEGTETRISALPCCKSLFILSLHLSVYYWTNEILGQLKPSTTLFWI